jgi:hypothetical protein
MGFFRWHMTVFRDIISSVCCSLLCLVYSDELEVTVSIYIAISEKTHFSISSYTATYFLTNFYLLGN